MKRLVVAFGLLVAGCASSVGPEPVDGVAAVRPSNVTDCAYLGDVTGVSGLYGVFVESGVRGARIEAQKQAVALGADSLALDPPTVGHGSTLVNGKAYDCSGG